MTLHFDYADEQILLAESLNRAFADRFSPASDDADAAFADATKLVAELGLIGPISRHDSAPDKADEGLSLVNTAVIAIEAGRAGLPFPLAEAIVAATLASAVRPDAVEAVASGRALATAMVGGSIDATPETGDRIRFKGKVLAPFADKARWIAVTTRSGPSQDGTAALIDIEAHGRAAGTVPGFDDRGELGWIEIDATVSGNETISIGLDRIIAVLAAAEMTGAAHTHFDKTIAYLGEREQFGKAIGSYQAVKHQASKLWVELQGMQAAVEYAAAAYDAQRPNDDGQSLSTEAFVKAAHIAKAYCSNAARDIAETSIQLHGGIGFTWDYGLGFPLTRINRLALTCGDRTQHLDAVADRLMSETAATAPSATKG